MAYSGTHWGQLTIIPLRDGTWAAWTAWTGMGVHHWKPVQQTIKKTVHCPMQLIYLSPKSGPKSGSWSINAHICGTVQHVEKLRLHECLQNFVLSHFSEENNLYRLYTLEKHRCKVSIEFIGLQQRARRCTGKQFKCCPHAQLQCQTNYCNILQTHNYTNYIQKRLGTSRLL